MDNLSAFPTPGLKLCPGFLVKRAASGNRTTTVCHGLTSTLITAHDADTLKRSPASLGRVIGCTTGLT